MQRVQKILSNRGFCSRRKAEELIEEGKVKVNEKTITIGDKAEESDEIRVNNEIVEKNKKIYLMFNKPPNCVTALKDKHNKTIMEYINLKERVFPVGRLDFNTSGLLLLTNDGDFANKIAHPSNEIKKNYVATLNKDINPHILKDIEKGIMLEDGITSYCKATLLSKNMVELRIHEGRNRIVRRIFKAVGFNVVKLERIKIGKLGLGNLKQGSYKLLKNKDIELIFQ